MVAAHQRMGMGERILRRDSHDIAGHDAFAIEVAGPAAIGAQFRLAQDQFQLVTVDIENLVVFLQNLVQIAGGKTDLLDRTEIAGAVAGSCGLDRVRIGRPVMLL